MENKLIISDEEIKEFVHNVVLELSKILAEVGQCNLKSDKLGDNNVV